MVCLGSPPEVRGEETHMTRTPSMGSVLPQTSYNPFLIPFTVNNTWTAARCQITSPCTTDLITCGRPASRLRYRLSHTPLHTHTHTRPSASVRWWSRSATQTSLAHSQCDRSCSVLRTHPRRLRAQRRYDSSTEHCTDFRVRIVHHQATLNSPS